MSLELVQLFISYLKGNHLKMPQEFLSGLHYPGSSLTITCSEGYHLSPGLPSSQVVCNSRLAWEFQNPKERKESGAEERGEIDLSIVGACIPNDCEGLPQVQDAEITERKAFKVDDVAEFTCKPGFVTKVGRKAIQYKFGNIIDGGSFQDPSIALQFQCNTSGLWDPLFSPMSAASSSPCSRISCLSPPSLSKASFAPVENSLVGTGFHFEFGSRVRYRCDEGFVFNSDDSNAAKLELECGPDGNWLGKTQECEEV